MTGYRREFRVQAARRLSAEQWARAVFEGAPRPLRLVLRFGWRVGLGLRLGPESGPEHVLGWRIASRTPDSVTLELRGGRITARNVARIDDGELSWTTSVRYESSLGRVLWSLAAPIHHLTMPYLLGRAVRSGHGLATG